MPPIQRDSGSSNISVITKPYFLSRHQITRAQFLTIMGTDPSQTGFSSGTDDPVQRASWYHAIAFCNKLSIIEGLDPVYSVAGVNFSTLTFSEVPVADSSSWNAAACDWDANGYRLPAEMEWMWAAMGATKDSRTGGINAEGVNITGYTKSYAGSIEPELEGKHWRLCLTIENSSIKTHPPEENWQMNWDCMT